MKNNYHWNDEEKNKIIEAIKIYNKNWKKVANYIGNKTPNQCKSHWQKRILKHNFNKFNIINNINKNKDVLKFNYNNLIKNIKIINSYKSLNIINNITNELKIISEILKLLKNNIYDSKINRICMNNTMNKDYENNLNLNMNNYVNTCSYFDDI